MQLGTSRWCLHPSQTSGWRLAGVGGFVEEQYELLLQYVADANFAFFSRADAAKYTESGDKRVFTDYRYALGLHPMGPTEERVCDSPRSSASKSLEPSSIEIRLVNLRSDAQRNALGPRETSPSFAPVSVPTSTSLPTIVEQPTPKSLLSHLTPHWQRRSFPPPAVTPLLALPDEPSSPPKLRPGPRPPRSPRFSSFLERKVEKPLPGLEQIQATCESGQQQQHRIEDLVPFPEHVEIPPKAAKILGTSPTQSPLSSPVRPKSGYAGSTDPPRASSHPKLRDLIMVEEEGSLTEAESTSSHTPMTTPTSVSSSISMSERQMERVRSFDVDTDIDGGSEMSDSVTSGVGSWWGRRKVTEEKPSLGACNPYPSKGWNAQALKRLTKLGSAINGLGECLSEPYLFNNHL